LRVDLAKDGDFTGFVRSLLSTLLIGGLVLTGCASREGSSASFSEAPSVGKPSASWSKQKLIVTPDNLLVGRIAKVNMEGRFVILTFPIGHLPAFEQRLSVYHQGLKSGEVRVTGPQLDDNVVGDLVTGDAQPGDEVRAQ
jgi:hypothetical protein